MTDNWKCGMVDWDQGSSGLCNGVGNQGMVTLKFGCTVRLIQESTVEENSSVVIWLASVDVVTKVRIQTSEWFICYRENIGYKTTVICA